MIILNKCTDLMRGLLLLLLCLYSSVSKAQDITGNWVGNYGFSLMSTQPQKVVVNLSLYEDSLVTGTSHLYYRNEKYEHYRINGVYHKKDSSIYFEEDSTIGVKLGLGESNVRCNYTMILHTNDTMMRLNGILKENGSLFTLMPTKVWLQKPLDVRPAKPKPVDKNLSRGVNVQNLVEISNAEQDSIKIEIWDNVQIDGDVISVYENDRMIIQNRKLDANRVTYYISVNRVNPIKKIMIAAESEGSVPPCTAHMLITTRLKKYEIDLSSDSRRNGALELFLKE
jgi:hypothetical protein